MSHIRGHRLSDRGFFCGSAVILGVLTAVIVVLSGAFLQDVWMVGDTRLFFAMADTILKGEVPYVDFQDPKPPLIYFTLAVPSLLGQQLYGSLALVGLCNLASALIVLRIGWRLYGRHAGLAAGVLFLVGMALAEGFFVMTEPFTVLFLLLSAYALLFMDRRYLPAGILAGIAIGFKQYALLFLPLALFYLYRKGDLKGVLPFFAGMLIPLAAIFGALFLAYGAEAGLASLHWSFGIADTYVTSGSIGDVPAYMAESPWIALANIGLEASLFMTMLTLAAAGVLLYRRLAPAEEFFLLSAAAFLSTLAIRQYLHYWALALPFIVLLCVRAYRQETPA